MIANRMQLINPSPTLAITARALEMKKQGLDVISFGAGEPDFDTPNHIKQAAIEAINQGFTKYTPTSGITELKTAICEKFKRENNLIYQTNNIIVSNGAKQCLYNLVMCLVNPGDEVIIPVPYWVSYEEMIKLAGGKCVFVKIPNGKINKKELVKAISKKTKLLMINSPSNPSGVVYTKEELEDIAAICVKNNLIVISDEVYEKLIYGKKHISIASLNKKIFNLTCVVNGVSKTYAMTGWRIGYCAANTDIVKACSTLQDHSTSNPNSIAQKAALAALIGSSDNITEMKKAYLKRREYMVKTLAKIAGFRPINPDGAFYVFCRISDLYGKKYNSSLEFCRQLLENKLVAVIPGSAFGDDEYIRLSFATGMDNIIKGLSRIKEFVNG